MIIYEAKNIINGKRYIGQTIQGFDKRYNSSGVGVERVYNYYLNSKKQKGRNKCNDHLFKSMNKYGINNFYVNKIFDIAFSFEELNIK